MPANPQTSPPSPNRDVLWLIFAALMLLVAIQLVPLRSTGWGKNIGIGGLVTAGWIFAARIFRVVSEWALREIPSPLTGPRENASDTNEPSPRP